MSTMYFDIYVNQVITLASTMVIKSIDTAKAINHHISKYTRYDVNPNDMTSWKYYMNLAGMYHPTDTPMQVRSLDTLETIDFTKDTLEVHRATKLAYQYGSRYYQDLVNQYPNQTMLILGILNPIDIEKAIDANDHEILYYDKELVEYQEYSLISSLQHWIYAFFSRWHVKGYVFDELYPSAQLGIMFAHLPNEILNIRLNACGTIEAHSFHIRQYLASHGRLDRYIEFLTLKQKLFLYRNAKYLQRHAGSIGNFDILIEKILTDRQLPIAKYDLHQLPEDILDAEDLLPDTELKRTALNTIPSDGSSDERSIQSILQAQFSVARGNVREYEEAVDTTHHRMRASQISSVPTKTLESAILDTTDSAPFLREEIIVHHWLYLASTERFNAVINVPNPTTGVSMTLPAKDAFVLYMWALNTSMGFEFPVIPSFVVPMVQKPVTPTIDELRQVVDPTRISDVWLAQLIEKQPPVGVYLSIASFREYTNDVFNALTYQRILYAQQYDPTDRAMLKLAASLCYQWVECSIDEGMFIEDWLDMKGYELHDMGQNDLALLANNILSEITGEPASVTGSVLGDLQHNMLEVMRQLSSYSVHYLQSINSEAFRVFDIPMPRVFNKRTEGQHEEYVELMHPRIYHTDTQGRSRKWLEQIFKPNIRASRSNPYSWTTLKPGLDFSIRCGKTHELRHIGMNTPKIQSAVSSAN